jgi:polyisoprenoid-binding protein YceI
MTRFFAVALTLVLAGMLLVAGSLQPPVSYTIEPTSTEMYVEGGSTIHDWSCPVKGLSGSLRVDTAQTVNASPASPLSGVLSTQVSVPVNSIQCDKETMNEKLREALQMNAYPEVYFSLEDAQVSPLPDSGAHWFAVDATGELILAGERRQIDLPVQGRRHDDGTLRLTGSHTIRLSDYDIDRPSALMGTITVSKEVTVHFDVTATPDTK